MYCKVGIVEIDCRQETRPQPLFDDEKTGNETNNIKLFVKNEDTLLCLGNGYPNVLQYEARPFLMTSDIY